MNWILKLINLLKSKTRGFRAYLRYKREEWFRGRRPHFEGHYSIWRFRRLGAIVDQYPRRFFDGKTVLELGAGHGDIGACFSGLGARVTCLEGRASNVKNICRRFPFLNARVQDLSRDLPGNDRFDVIVHFGLLYHLADPERSLRDSCRRCDHLILETEVADSDDPKLVRAATEPAFIFDQSLDGAGSRPSPALIERILCEEGFGFRRLFESRCNWELHTYDWPARNNGEYHNGQRRMWIAGKAP